MNTPLKTPLKSATQTLELEHQKRFFDESTLFDFPDPMISNPLQDHFEQLMNPSLKKRSQDSTSSAWVGKVIIVVSLLILLIFVVAVLLIYVNNEVFPADGDENWLLETIQVQQGVLGVSYEFPSGTPPSL